MHAALSDCTRVLQNFQSGSQWRLIATIHEERKGQKKYIVSLFSCPLHTVENFFAQCKYISVPSLCGDPSLWTL